MAGNQSESLIFVSWAGEVSKQVAFALRDLLRNTIHTATPWMSESDIDKGARWRSEIETRLDAAVAGVIVLTPENLARPWLLFEAGALSKKNSRVYTYLFDIPKGGIGEPLSQFQDTTTSEGDTKALVRSINQKLGTPIEEERILKAFQHNWPEFQETLTRIPKSASVPLPRPDPALVMQEMLGYLRASSRDMEKLKSLLMVMYTNTGGPRADLSLKDMAGGRYQNYIKREASTPVFLNEKVREIDIDIPSAEDERPPWEQAEGGKE